jgi:hypothetical protein
MDLIIDTDSVYIAVNVSALDRDGMIYIYIPCKWLLSLHAVYTVLYTITSLMTNRRAWVCFLSLPYVSSRCAHVIAKASVNCNELFCT